MYGSLPKKVLFELQKKYKENLEFLKLEEDGVVKNSKLFDLRKRYFAKLDKVIDQVNDGPHFLRDKRIRLIVEDQLKKLDGELYDLIAYSVMSNHVHIIIDTSIQIDKLSQSESTSENYVQLDQIMKRIKGPTAVYCNRELNRSGQFWARESWDTYIRSERMFNNVISYILNNPVKAGLVRTWEEYEGNYFRD